MKAANSSPQLCGAQQHQRKRRVANVQLLITTFSRLGIVPDQVSALAGERLKLQSHRWAIIHTGFGDTEQEILTVLPGEGQVIASISGFQFKQILNIGAVHQHFLAVMDTLCQQFHEIRHILICMRQRPFLRNREAQDVIHASEPKKTVTPRKSPSF